MPSYYARSVWYIGASLEAVWKPLVEVEDWPRWWPEVRSAMELEAGFEGIRGSLKRCTWRGSIAPDFTFNLRITRIIANRLLEGEVRGQLEGTTHWQLTPQSEGCAVHLEWSFHTNIWWLSLLTPMTRHLYPRIFDGILQNGGRSLSAHLNASLLPDEEVEIPHESMLV